MTEHSPDRAAAAPFPGFEQFYAAALPTVVGRVFLMVGRSYLAEDLAQDAMVEMMRQWAERGDRAIDDNIAWTVGIAANLTRRHQRRLMTGARAIARWAGRHRPSVVSLETEVLARNETYRRFDRLTRQQRRIAVLWILLDMTGEEIAERLEISPSTVRTHFQKIRKVLAEHIEPEIIIGGRQSTSVTECQP